MLLFEIDIRNVKTIHLTMMRNEEQKVHFCTIDLELQKSRSVLDFHIYPPPRPNIIGCSGGGNDLPSKSGNTL